MVKGRRGAREARARRAGATTRMRRSWFGAVAGVRRGVGAPRRRLDDPAAPSYRCGETFPRGGSAMRLPFRAASALMLASVIASPANDLTVKVGHNGLTPGTVTIGKGDTVVFLNTQDMPGGHTVVADDGSFSSPALAKDKSWSHVFDKSGTYKVHLKEHPDAGGEIVVK